MVHALAPALDELPVRTVAGLPLDQFDLQVAAAAERDVEPDVRDAPSISRARHAAVHEPEWAVQGLIQRDSRLQIAHDVADLHDGRQAEGLQGSRLRHQGLQCDARQLK